MLAYPWGQGEAVHLAGHAHVTEDQIDGCASSAHTGPRLRPHGDGSQRPQRLDGRNSDANVGRVSGWGRRGFDTIPAPSGDRNDTQQWIRREDLLPLRLGAFLLGTQRLLIVISVIKSSSLKIGRTLSIASCSTNLMSLRCSHGFDLGSKRQRGSNDYPSPQRLPGRLTP
jgi:hypothetical protein